MLWLHQWLIFIVQNHLSIYSEGVFMSRLTNSNYSKYQEPKGVKIVVVGPSGVGKTSLSNRFVKDQFSGRVPATMGAAFSEKMF